MAREATPPMTDVGQPRAAEARQNFDLGVEIIRSRENRRIKAFRAALQGGGPGAGEALAVEGRKLVEEGLRAGLELEALLVSESGEKHLKRVLAAARETEEGVARSRIWRTTDKLLAAVAGTETPQGIAALFRQPEWGFEDVLRGAPFEDGSFRGDAALVAVLVGVQDPGNVGTTVRSAEAFGATGLIATRGTADPWSPKAVRASAGSALRLPLLRGMAAPLVLAQLRVAGARVYAAVSSKDYDAEREKRQQEDAPERRNTGRLFANLTDSSAILIGSEGHGLPAEIENAADEKISIPIGDPVDSLNAGIAASILLYEAERQRRSAAR